MIPAGAKACVVWQLFAAAAICANAALPQEAYVWQRAWTQPVRQSVQTHGSQFSSLALLAAEISWHGHQPTVQRIPLPGDAICSVTVPIGLVLRIGPYPGPFAESDTTAGLLAALAKSLVLEQQDKGVKVCELQIDFDCAESKLDGYRQWVLAIQKAIPGTQLAITALPVWLKRAEFPALALTAGRYILQVHSLEKPASFDAPFTLCDPEVARSAVNRAASLGVPFRVALPTYGYLLAFAQDGRFIGLSAEGPAKTWPENVKLRAVESDPVSLAKMLTGWNAHPPAAMQGVIWYRLPNGSDNLNWRWPTLEALLHGRTPHRHLIAESRRTEPGLQEIRLVNDGDLDITALPGVKVHWQTARFVAGDAMHGFKWTQPDATHALFQPASPVRVRTGENETIGWVRLNQDAGMTLELIEP